MTVTADAFFLPEGDGWFLATDNTRGPWDPDHQHAGPPIALVGTALASVGDAQDRRVARVTTEILRPVPVGRLRVEATVRRPGRRVDLVEGRLSDADGDLLLVRAWRVRTGSATVGPLVAPDGAPPGPAGAKEPPFFDLGWDVGYHTAMEWRFVHGGGFQELGPATAWLRMRLPLVAGEPTSPLSRVLCAADSGNGVSASLPLDRAIFINTELTVHLHRYPRGEWVCLDARTVAEPDGIGLATSTIADEHGVIGRGAQSLLVADR